MQKRMSLVALLYTSFFFYFFFAHNQHLLLFLFSRILQFQGRTGSSPSFSFIVFISVFLLLFLVRGSANCRRS
ncbi:hypothetical protein EDD21DRAFT_145045 [Dissophora ornata]|nr:hypothetical protein EDD21DRAFT_145045 [Dissophora ornata]